MLTRKMVGRIGCIAIGAGLILAGCASAPTVVPESERAAALPATLSSFVPRSIQADGETTGESPAPLQTGSITSAWGCSVDFEFYAPAGQESPDRLVVLGHGFMRDLTRMRGWAAEWASRGVPTVVLSFCNSSWFNGHHDRNAADMIAVAREIQPRSIPVLYAGFSAGGLSALLAASQDANAIGYLGLDPVDSGDLASTVDRLDMPALFLFGAPQSCNAQSNMEAVMPAASTRIALRIPNAVHCDFENPYDSACAGICGSVEPPAQELEIRRTIGALATAWVEAQMGASANAQSVFSAPSLAELKRLRRVQLVGR